MVGAGKIELMFKIKNIQKACPERSRRGYTLIELLVVLAMIVLLTIFALPSYNSFRANQETRQKVDEIKELIQQAYNSALNPESGVIDYAVIFDESQNKVVLESYKTLDTPFSMVKEIALSANQTLQCNGTGGLCGVLKCDVTPQEQQENVCKLNDPGNDGYYNLSNDPASDTLTISVNDSDTNKYFYWDGLDNDNKFEITGLKTNVEPIN